MANDDAINEFAPEEPGESRPALPHAAEPPRVPSSDVYASAAPAADFAERADVDASAAPEADFDERADVDASAAPEVDFDELADVDVSAAPEVDFDQLADVYASVTRQIDAPAPEIDPAASADVYASPTSEVDAVALADAYGASPSVGGDLNASPDDYSGAHQLPAPFESSGGVQVIAALATVGMLTIMYAVFVNQRSSTPLSIPSQVTSPAPAPTPAPEPDQLASLEPPVASDATIPPLPTVRPRPFFDDPFGLTRGLSPSIPLQGFDVPAPAPAAADNATPPAADPAPVAAGAVAPAAAAAAPEPPPRASSASSPAVPPPSAATPPPSATSPPAATPTSATPSPIVTPSVPRNAAIPPASSLPSASAGSPPSTAALAPAPAPAPARSSATPAAVTPPAAAASIETNQTGIQNTLARYRKAFSALSASAAREVWPTVNERSLSRAFDRLEQQDVSFDRCQIEVTNNDRAEARCNGTARYVPRVGSRTPRVDQREWRFNLVKVKDEWLIGAVDAR